MIEEGSGTDAVVNPMSTVPSTLKSEKFSATSWALNEMSAAVKPAIVFERMENPVKSGADASDS
jgi:hypothetical protein